MTAIHHILLASRMLCKGCYSISNSISIVLEFSTVVVVVCCLRFEYCLKYSRDQKIDDCVHATAIGIIVGRSMIVNQHISVHRFFDFTILYGDTTDHYGMCRAVIADPFVFRE